LKALIERVDNLALKLSEIENIAERLEDKHEKLDAKVEDTAIDIQVLSQAVQSVSNEAWNVSKNPSAPTCGPNDSSLVTESQYFKDCHDYIRDNIVNADIGGKLFGTSR
jgi:hypothetical protein